MNKNSNVFKQSDFVFDTNYETKIHYKEGFLIKIFYYFFRLLYSSTNSTGIMDLNNRYFKGNYLF